MIIKFLKFFVPLVLLGFLFSNVAQDWKSILIYKEQLQFIPLILSFLILLTVYPEGAYCWYLILKKENLNVPIYSAMKIWIISNTGRYVPGKIWQYIGRVEMAHRLEDIPKIKTISSLLLETFLVLVAGLLASLLSLVFINFNNYVHSYWYLIVVSSLIVLHPVIANRFIDVIAKITKRDIKKFDMTLSLKSTLSLIPWFMLNFFLNGIALAFLANSIGIKLDILDLLKYIGFYSISWVLGFVSIIAPAGIGVAEVSLAYLLSLSGIPIAIASAIAIIYRFLLTLSEAVVFLIVLKYRGNER